MIRCVLLFLAALGAVPGATAQEVTFERATRVEAALPQSTIYAILEDRRGFLWFATREGLGRWDGTTMRTWRRDPFDRASLPGNLVRQLVEDEAGDLWARAEATDWTPKGIARLVGPGHDEVRRYEYPSAEVVVGPDGEAWLADSTHLWRFDRPRDAFVRVRERIRSSRPVVGLVTRDQTLWIASEGGLEAYPARGRARTVPTDTPWEGEVGASHFAALAEGPDGALWVGGSRLGRLTGTRTQVETLDFPLPEIPSYGEGFGITRILPDRGGLWLATLDGVYRYSTEAGTLARHSLRLPGDIATQNHVADLHRDRAGTLWAGTPWGLHRATPGGNPFRLIAHDPDDPNTIGSGIVLSIARDPRGSLWIGTLGGGLNRIAPDGTVTRYRSVPDDPTTLLHDWIWSLAADEETLWIGTGHGLHSIALDAPATVRRYPYDEALMDAAGPSANALHLDDEGTLWYGHVGGLHRRSDASGSEITPLWNGLEEVRTVPGGAWLATAAGLLRYDEAEDTFQTFRHDPDDPLSISDDATLALHIDRSGRLWVGTQSGLDRYEPDLGGFVHFDSDDGLPSNVVYAILEDDDGRIWISTNRGLARYDESAPQPFRAYTEADGVGNVEFNRHAAWRDADGTMYFGGDRGVTVFHPDDLAGAARQSPVVVTALRRSTRDGTVRDAYVDPAGVSLAPEVTTFGFEFAALDFVHAHQSRYVVRLEGWDEDWVEIGAQQQATYTNLPPGRYTFHVRAANADGVWGKPTEVPVVVRPAWWETAWFRLLALLVAAGLVAGVGWDVSRRRYRRELAALRAKRALDAERARISRDMHDEVGASLSEIAILSELAQLSASGDGAPAPPTGRLRQIAETSRETLDSIAEIVWALNPTNDRLPTLAAYLREQAARYAESTGLRATLRFPAHPLDRPVSAEVRRAVFLILKEALHNVVKHAGATGVDVTLLLPGDSARLGPEAGGASGSLVLIVADDGCGGTETVGGDGAPARIRGGNGLRNMRQRAEEIGGTLRVEPGATGGTVVRLSVPLGEAVRA